MMAARPFGALGPDTAEYMLGDVAVTLVLMESSGSVDPSTENWTPSLIQQVKSKVETGLQWWVDTLEAELGVPTGQTSNLLNFVTDFTHADAPVATAYEPIARVSNDFTLWVNEFLSAVGMNSTAGWDTDMRAFNDAQRVAHDADWGFTMFVVNDQVDSDNMFQAGGSFRQAFAFAGGLFLISPASRPISTFAHEVGHMFWAKDEYGHSDASCNERRGYYNTVNSNFEKDPGLKCDGTVQDASIMASGSKLQDGFAANTSSRPSLEMVGWRDSDSDGIFDVLDVPHRLSGSGFVDPQSGNYRFIGQSSVQTLPNRNSSGLGNDITINRIDRAQYRIDGGAWQTAATYDAPAVTLDLTIPLPAGQHQVEIRTIDDRTGVTSAIFQGTTARPTSVLRPGINGFVFNDQDADGVWDTGEQGLQNWTVQLVDQQGQPLQLQKRVEPDDFADNAVLTGAVAGVTLTAVGSNGAQLTGVDVVADECGPAATGTKTFFYHSPSQNKACQEQTGWTDDTRLRIDLANPVTTVSLDAISNLNGIDELTQQRARLEIYDANDTLLARYTTVGLGKGQIETMTLSRPTADIKYAIAYGHLEDTRAIRFDNLRLGPSSSGTTDAQGAYAIPHLTAGSYSVKLAPPAGWVPTAPASGRQTVTVQAGQAVSPIDFGSVFATATWQNPVNRYDVNADGLLAPVDALLVINELNRNGSRTLDPPSGSSQPPPYYDVNGDSFLAPIDALHVINELNREGSGEGEMAGSSGRTGGSSQSARPGSSTPTLAAEGEAAGWAFVALTSDDLQRSVFSQSVVAGEPSAPVASPLVSNPTTGSKLPGPPTNRDATGSALPVSPEGEAEDFWAADCDALSVRLSSLEDLLDDLALDIVLSI